jgi:hypothetical protein
MELIIKRLICLGYEKGIWKEAMWERMRSFTEETCNIERMDYLMNEEIKSERSEGYYNVSQSDLRSLVRGELNVLKATLVKAKSGILNTETKYEDSIKRIELILNPK